MRTKLLRRLRRETAERYRIVKSFDCCYIYNTVTGNKFECYNTMESAMDALKKKWHIHAEMYLVIEREKKARTKKGITYVW